MNLIDSHHSGFIDTQYISFMKFCFSGRVERIITLKITSEVLNHQLEMWKYISIRRMFKWMYLKMSSRRSLKIQNLTTCFSKVENFSGFSSKLDIFIWPETNSGILLAVSFPFSDKFDQRLQWACGIFYQNFAIFLWRC